MNALSEKKILSIGVYANEKKAASPNKEKIAVKASRDAYRAQLERDMAIKTENAERERESDTLHPFDRAGPSRLREKHNENIEEEACGGYHIGKDANSEENIRRRRDVQRRYLDQLELDAAISREIRENEEASPSKKVIKRRPASPEVKGDFFIGAASSAGGEEKLEQAKLFYEMNQEEINRKQMERTQQRSRDVDIDGRFSIGADEDKKKRDKQSATKAYLEALNKDLGDRGQTRKERQHEEYVNKTGWSGLNIGGSGGGSSAASAQHTQKDKQIAYKKLLDTQMSDAMDRQMAEKKREDEELRNSAMPPYLENSRE